MADFKKMCQNYEKGKHMKENLTEKLDTKLNVSIKKATEMMNKMYKKAQTDWDKETLLWKDKGELVGQWENGTLYYKFNQLKESNFDKILRILQEESGNNEIDSEFKQGVKEIKQMTSNNEHSKALVAGAELLNYNTRGNDKEIKKLIKLLSSIEKRHMKTGHLTQELSDERSKYAEQLFDKAKEILSPKEFEMFDRAY